MAIRSSVERSGFLLLNLMADLLIVLFIAILGQLSETSLVDIVGM